MSNLDLNEDQLNRKSRARQRIIDRINNADFSDFDATPWKDPNVIRPIPGKQEQFLATDDVQVVLYGGSAGSGKTEAIVLDQLRHIHDPNFESITFRRNTKSLKGAGGVFNKAGTVYMKLGAEQRLADMLYRFPQGSVSRYSHLEHGRATAEANHAGLEYSAIYFDELHLFPKDAFFFMMSRLRSNAKIQSYIKATCNPTPKEAEGGWLHEFLEGFYIDEYGYPIEENSGKVRYFISQDDGTLAWGDSRDEMKARYGMDCDPISFTFISAIIVDNPVVCKLQPSYLRALKNMGRIERERLLYGCWNVSAKGSGYFQREWIDFVDPKDVPKRKKTVRAWDLASSIKSEVNNDPDSSAGVKISLCEDGYYYVESAKEFQDRPAGVLSNVIETAELDGRNCFVSIPKDAGAAGEFAYLMFAKPLIHSGYRVKKSKTRKGKLERFMGFSNAAENGLVKVVRGGWNDKWIAQLENFDPDRKRQHDDLVDATSDSYNLLNNQKGVQKITTTFSPASLTKANEFSKI